MSAVDLIVLGILGLVGIIGWYQGLIRSVLSVVGTVAGGVAASMALPWILTRVDMLGISAALLSVGVILLGVAIGNAIAVTLGRPLWKHLQVGAARVVDAALGSLVSVVAGLLVMWAVAATITAMPSPLLSNAVQQSALLAQVDRLVPSQAAQWAYSVRDLLGKVRIPEVFFGLGGLPGSEVKPPPKDVPPVVVASSQSVVRVWGPTPSCGQGSTGSGFVYAEDRIATDAHVVAGMSHVTVSAQDGRSWGADVVLFNPELDVAVLFVPGLGLPALSAGERLQASDPAVIVGFPGGGEMDIRGARVVTTTSESPVFSDNIYGDPTRPRDIYVVRGRVVPGNSGGPLLDRAGRYVGIVFASSRQFERTGFALTNRTVASDLEKGRRAQVPVGTGTCAR